MSGTLTSTRLMAISEHDPTEVGQQLGEYVEAGRQGAVDDAVVGGQRHGQGQARHKRLPSTPASSPTWIDRPGWPLPAH